MKRTDEVDYWLQRIQDIEGDVVQVIQKADQEIQGRCFGGYCLKNCWTARKIGKLVIRKLPIVNDLRSKGNFVDVAYKLSPPLVQIEPVDLTVGMESMFEKVLKLLAEDEVRIIGLYGSGGVGKTTLLKLINNEFGKSTTSSSNIHGFDVVIQEEIGNRLGLSSPNKSNIFDALTKKNFLLLLDDIWERIDLQSIGVPRPEKSKSKVIFTTRDETVCGDMDANERFRVECLPSDKALILFQEKVGEVALNSFPRARELAKDVARECGGLPLALITIGRAMSTKKNLQEWNHAITTLKKAASDFRGMDIVVLPRLKLSYDYLHDETIKSCFLYCALFPEDRYIKKAKLIDYWIGEELILLNEFDHIDEARDKGYHIIEILKRGCLLESGKNEETQVKMHDTIRDLALWIAHERVSKRDKMLIIESFYGTSEKWFSAERIYLRPHHNCHVTEVLPPPIKSPNLLTLVYGRPSSYKLPPDSPSKLHVLLNFFQFMPLLRVLDLSRSLMEIFPTSITELLELLYLSLSRTRIQVLPEELRKLVKLNHLDLSYMKDLEKIPSGVIGSLLELRVLNLFRCPLKDWDIEKVFELKHLDDLRITIKTQHNLNKLLSLSNYMAQQQHLGSCFQNLREIDIRYCNALKDLAWVGYVGNLKKLFVFFCNELEELVKFVDDFGGGTTGGGDEISLRKIMNNVKDIFKSLEVLSICHLPKLKSICRNALAFPCLKFIVVFNCPELKKLPFDSGSNVNNTLQKIQGE